MKVREFTTLAGSMYRYLDDGRVQRQKHDKILTFVDALESATELSGEELPPRDVTVFVPPFEILVADIPQEERMVTPYGRTSEEYTLRVGKSIHNFKGNLTVGGNPSSQVKTNAEAAQVGEELRVWLSEENEISVPFSLPAVATPQLGYHPVEQLFDPPSTHIAQHFGHAVRSITYVDGSTEELTPEKIRDALHRPEVDHDNAMVILRDYVREHPEVSIYLGMTPRDKIMGDRKSCYYAFGPLPPEDKVELEYRLATEAHLLDRLRLVETLEADFHYGINVLEK